MSQTTKIQNLTPQGTFEFNGKTFYKSDVILESGEVGEVNAMTADKWKVGDEVIIRDQQHTKWGVRLKLDRPGFDGSSGTSRSKGGDDETTKGIIASWAVGCAMSACKTDPSSSDYDSMVLHLAKIALLSREAIKKEVEV